MAFPNYAGHYQKITEMFKSQFSFFYEWWSRHSAVLMVILRRIGPCNQQFVGSFSKVPLPLAKLPLKFLLCEENFHRLLFSVCSESVSTSMLNKSTKFQCQQGRYSQGGIVFSEVRTTEPVRRLGLFSSGDRSLH